MFVAKKEKEKENRNANVEELEGDWKETWKKSFSKLGLENYTNTMMQSKYKIHNMKIKIQNETI